MWSRTWAVILLIVFILWGFYYFLVDSSYSKAIEAKILFYEERYEESRDLAKIAYEEDQYNRMAFTVLVQSKEAIKWNKYIQESAEFLLRAKEITDKPAISKGDRLEIKIMAEIVLDGYLNLIKKSPFIDDEKKAKAEFLYTQFQEIYDELN